MPRLALLTNIVAPYRVPIYGELSRAFQLRILVSGREDNRPWRDPAAGETLDVRTVPGLTIRRHSRTAEGRAFDLQYTHVNPGYIRHLAGFRPQAIISTEMGARSISALAYATATRTPLWIWWGGTLHTERSRGWVKRLLRTRLFARSRCRWISYGLTSTEYLAQVGVPADRILQVQNCVDPFLFSDGTVPLALDLPRPRALLVGQMIGRKGLYEYVRAAAEVIAGGQQFSTLVVGDGPEAAAFDKAAQSVFGSEGYRRMSPLDYEQMSRAYRSADFLVFPSLEDVWGLAVNEAILSGLPVLCSIFAGCAQEIVPVRNRFDPTSHQSFVDALRLGIAGQAERTPPETLLTPDQVGMAIADDIRRVIGSGA